LIRANAVIFWVLLNGVVNALYIFEPFIGLGGPPIALALFNYTVPIATAFIALQFWRAARSAGSTLRRSATG
jgi:hypothetical protein